MAKSTNRHPYDVHDTHQVRIQLVSSGKHFAKIHCVTCNKWIKWLSRSETNVALAQGLVDE
jgi:hypothetical protein